MYKHEDNYYRLITKRESNINTFLLVDKFDKPIKHKVKWSFHEQEIIAIFNGFDKLEKQMSKSEILEGLNKIAKPSDLVAWRKRVNETN